MIFLNKRSNKKELLDAPHIPFADIAKNMEELDVINNKLGGHRITIKGIQSLIPETAEIVRIAEIGCGGGDNLRAIKNWASRNGRQIELLGIDHNEACIAYARNRPLNSGIRFEISDYRAYKFDKKPDIIFSSLFCHHFNENDLIFMLNWMKQHTSTGFFINDLHRNLLAYASIQLLTNLFSKSYLVKHDAPVSVLRGFSKNDLKGMLHAADIDNYSIQWMWAFRWLVTVKND